MPKKKKQKKTKSRAQRSHERKLKTSNKKRNTGGDSGGVGNSHGLIGSMRGTMQNATSGKSEKANAWISAFLWLAVVGAGVFAMYRFGYIKF